MIKRTFLLFLSALLLAPLFGGISGCNTIQGAGKDIEGAGKAIKDGANEVKKKL
jgi:entericidin B